MPLVAPLAGISSALGGYYIRLARVFEDVIYGIVIEMSYVNTSQSGYYIAYTGHETGGPGHYDTGTIRWGV